jgi:hypothetical protein
MSSLDQKLDTTVTKMGVQPAGLQNVSLKAVAITAGASALLYIGGEYYGFPLWAKVLAAIIPWAPLFFLEAAWKYENYGTYMLLGVFVILQIGHLGEHTAQVLQLWVADGDLSAAHGVFGALDRELVHFVWDSFVWIGLLWAVYQFGVRNKWLWVSLVAASFHEVEHIFLFYLDRFHTPFYEAGGTTGLLAKGGMIGSPFARPYLHYIYNFVVVVPLIIAFWDETKYAYNKWLARALPDLTEQEKISTSTQLDPVRVEAGQTIFKEGDKADNFYIVTEGEVEVVRGGNGSEMKIATLGPGQFFGEMGLLTGRPRMATVRATKETHLMALDASEFGNLMTRSRGGAADIAYEMKQRSSGQAPTPAAT